MAKKIDAIITEKNHALKKQTEDVLDLRKVPLKQPRTKKTDTPKTPDSSLNNETDKNIPIKIVPNSQQASKKMQPLWWTIEERYYYNSWLSIIMFVSSVIFLIVAFLQKNWVFFIIIILANILFILYFLKPQKLLCRLTAEGMYVNEDFYPYQNISHFWIMETPDRNFLIFKTNSLLNKNLFLPFKKEKTEKIRGFLINFLIEKEIRPSLLDLLSNIF